MNGRFKRLKSIGFGSLNKLYKNAVENVEMQQTNLDAVTEAADSFQADLDKVKALIASMKKFLDAQSCFCSGLGWYMTLVLQHSRRRKNNRTTHDYLTSDTKMTTQ